MTDLPEIPTRRWIIPLLVVSLAGNLLVLGIVVGWLASPDGPKRQDWRSARGLVGEPFIRALPAHHRRALLKDVLRDDSRVHESRESLRARFDAFLTELRSEQFDIDQISALLKEQRNVALSRQDLGEGLLLQRLGEMSLAERRAYADALEDALKRRRR